MEDWKLKNITPEFGIVYAAQKDGNYVFASNPNNTRFDLYKNIGNSSTKKYVRHLDEITDFKIGAFSSSWIENNFLYYISTTNFTQVVKYNLMLKRLEAYIPFSNTINCDFIALKVKNGRTFTLHKETGNPKAILKEKIPNTNNFNYSTGFTGFPEDVKDFDVQNIGNDFIVTTIHEDINSRRINIYKSSNGSPYVLVYTDSGIKTVSTKQFYNSVTISEKGDEIVTGCILSSSNSKDLYLKDYKLLDGNKVIDSYPSSLNQVYGNNIGTTDKIVEVKFLLDNTTLYFNDNNTWCWIYTKNTNTNIWEVKGDYFPRTRIFPFIALNDINFFKSTGGYYEFRSTEYPFRQVNWSKDTLINSTTLRGTSPSDCFGINVQASPNGDMIAVASNGKIGDLSIYFLDPSTKSLYNFLYRHTGVLDHSFGFLDDKKLFFMDSNNVLKVTSNFNSYHTWQSFYSFPGSILRKATSDSDKIFVYWETLTEKFVTIVNSNYSSTVITLNHSVPDTYNFSSFTMNSKSIIISYISTNSNNSNRIYSYSYTGNTFTPLTTLVFPYDLVESYSLAKNEDILYLVNRKDLNVYTLINSAWEKETSIELYQDNQPFIKLSLSTTDDGTIIAIGNGEKVRLYRFDGTILSVYGNEIIGDYIEDNFGSNVCFIKNTEDLIISSPSNSSNYYSSGRINFYTSSPLISLNERIYIPGVYDSGEYYFYRDMKAYFEPNIRQVYKRTSKDTWEVIVKFQDPASSGSIYLGNGSPDRFNLDSEYYSHPFYLDLNTRNIYKNGILIINNNIVNVIWGDVPADQYRFKTFYNGDYYVDRKRGELYGPYSDFTWKNSKIFTLPESFKTVNNFFVKHNFVLSQNLSLFNSSNIVIDPVNNFMYGPTASDVNILPRKVIIKDYVKPTQSIGFVGEYLYSSSLRKLYGPKAVDSWPDNNIILPLIFDLESNVEMYVGSTDSLQPSKLVSSDNILLDLSKNTIYQGGGNSSVKIFRKVLVGAGIPSSSIGIVGDYFIDQSTLEIYGPKTVNGVWETPNIGYWPDVKLLNLPIYITESLIETAFINQSSFCIINLSTNMVYIRQLDKNQKIQLSSISFARYPDSIPYIDAHTYPNSPYTNPALINNSILTTVIFYDKAKNKTKNIIFSGSALTSNNTLCYLNTGKTSSFQGPKNGEGKNGDYFVEYIPFSDQSIRLGPKVNDKWLFNPNLVTTQTSFVSTVGNIFDPNKYYLNPDSFNIIYPTYNRSSEISPVKFPKSYNSSLVYITNLTPTPSSSSTNLTYFTGDGRFYISNSITVSPITVIEKAIIVDKIEDLPEFRYAYTINNNKLYSKGDQNFIINIHKSYDFIGDIIISTSSNLTFLQNNIVNSDIVFCTDNNTFYHFPNPTSTFLTQIPVPIKAYFYPSYPSGFITDSQAPVYILQGYINNKWDLLQKKGNDLIKLNRNIINYPFNPSTSNVYIVKNNKTDLSDFDPTDIVLFYDAKSYHSSSTSSGYIISFLQIPDSTLKITPYNNSPTSVSLINYGKFVFDNTDLTNIKNIKIKHIKGNYFVVSVMYEDDRFNFVQVFFFDDTMNYLCRVGEIIRAAVSLPVGNKPKDKVKDFLKRTPKERAATEKTVRKVSNSVFNFFTEVVESVTPDIIEDKVSNILRSTGITKDILKNFITNNIVDGVRLVENGFQSMSNLIFDLDEGGEGSFGEDTFYLEKYNLVYIGAPTSYLDKRGTVRLVETTNKTIIWVEGNREIGRFGTSIAVGGPFGEVLAVGQPGVFTSDVVGMVKVYEKNSDNIFGYRRQNKGFAVMSIVKNTLRAAATGALIGLAISGVILPVIGVLVAPLGAIGIVLFVLIGVAVATIVSLAGDLWEGSFDEWSTVEGEGALFHTGSNIVMSNDGQTLVVPEIRRPAQMDDSIKEKSSREKAYDFISKFGETISVTQNLSNLFSPKEGAVVESGLKTAKTPAVVGSVGVDVINYGTYLKRAQVYKKLLLSSVKEIGKVTLSSVDKVTLLTSSVKNTKYLKIKNIVSKMSKCAVGVDFAVSVIFLGDSITSAVSFGKLVDRIDKDLDADKFSSVNLYSRSDEWRPSKKRIDLTLKNIVNIFIKSNPSKLKTTDEKTMLADAKANPTKYNTYSPALFTGKSMFGYGSSVGISGNGETVVAIDKNYINDSPKNLIQRATSLFSEDATSLPNSTFTDYKIIIYKRKYDTVKQFYYWEENTNQIEEKILTEEPLRDYTQVIKLSFDGKYLAVGSPFYSEGNQVLKGRIVVYQINATIPIKLFSIEGISEYQFAGQGISFETTSSGTSLIVSDFDEEIESNGFSVKYNKFILSS